jgi:hypothetical protein
LATAHVRDSPRHPGEQALERSADIDLEGPLSTRSSIWLGESEEKHVHIYWELADREMENGRMLGAPICLAVDSGIPDREVAIRLAKDIDEIGQII